LTLRVAALEQRVSEQDAALRRVLSMMIELMDKEGGFEAYFVQKSRAA
jgi:general secretion pathway protein A